MLKRLYRAVASTLLTLITAEVTLSNSNSGIATQSTVLASALDTSICFMRMQDGRVYELKQICGKRPAFNAQTSPTRAIAPAPAASQEELDQEMSEDEAAADSAGTPTSTGVKPAPASRSAPPNASTLPQGAPANNAIPPTTPSGGIQPANQFPSTSPARSAPSSAPGGTLQRDPNEDEVR